MKTMLKKIAWFVIPLAVLLVGSSVLSKAVLKNGNFFTLEPQVKYLILGHSQPECGLNDSLIAGARNFSQGGESYFYTYQKIKKLLEVNPQVETVFISYANNQISNRMDKWVWGNENMYANYPKYSFMMNWDDYKILFDHNPQEVMKSETKVVRDFLTFMAKNGDDYLSDRNWGGYLYLNRNLVDSLIKTDYAKKERDDIKSELSPTNIEYLKKIVAFCKEKKVRVIFFRMPVWPDLPFLKNEKQYLDIKQKYFGNVEMIDFKDFPVASAEMGDLEHFNHKGARRFSKFFDGLLQRGLLKSADMQGDIQKAMHRVTAKDSIQ